MRLIKFQDTHLYDDTVASRNFFFNSLFINYPTIPR